MLPEKLMLIKVLENVQEFWRLEAKNMGKMFKINGIFGKSHIFLDNIGHNFETSGWIYCTKTNIM